MRFVVHIGVSLLPVFCFLASLVILDSYKLVRRSAVARSLVAGFVAALVCYLIHRWLLPASGVSFTSYSRYVSPAIEEIVKSAFVVYLIARHKVGFLVDAAILGFAVGAGFAFIENIYYLASISDASLLTWVIRGFGTAIMHGGTTALFAMLLRSAVDRYASPPPVLALPGLVAVVIFHSVFNHFPLRPLLSTLLLLIVLPLGIAVVFHQSERVTRKWLGVGFDGDQELLQLIRKGGIGDSHIGQYLNVLRSTFDGTVVADMLCYLRLRVELSIHAKGILLMRDAGFEPKPDAGTTSRFAELRYLEKQIGKTGLLAIAPLINVSSRDVWQIHFLEPSSGKPGKG
jgi:RsiW-degrading membrane proteinase PrsW (M82 family)